MAQMDACLVLALALALASGCSDSRRPSGPRPDGGPGADSGSMTMGSGLDSSRTVGDLSPTEIGQLCEYSTTASGGPGTEYPCPDGNVSVQTVEECTSSVTAVSDGCGATVGQVEACAHFVASDACSSLSHSECLALLACATAR